MEFLFAGEQVAPESAIWSMPIWLKLWAGAGLPPGRLTSAPDTGSVSPWRDMVLKSRRSSGLPLLAGEIRSAFAMTEPVASRCDQYFDFSRADGDEWVISGEKFYISGAGDAR